VTSDIGNVEDLKALNVKSPNREEPLRHSPRVRVFLDFLAAEVVEAA
jgi:hypothetical protein